VRQALGRNDRHGDAKDLQRRAELLLALAKTARDDNYIQLADRILDRADQPFEEARIR
jgi:hypothetical protein